jgi:murein endopeptidase
MSPEYIHTKHYHLALRCPKIVIICQRRFRLRRQCASNTNVYQSFKRWIHC